MIGSTLGNYKILEKLGAGGQGTVYKAVDSKLGRTVVIKVLPEELVTKEANVKRFEREARLASSLDHPNICTIFDLNVIDGVHFIAMQYIPGPWPFRGKPGVDGRHAVLHEEPAPLSIARPEPLPERLQQILHRALKKHPRDRYQQIGQFGDDLRAVVRDMAAPSGAIIAESG